MFFFKLIFGTFSRWFFILGVSTVVDFVVNDAFLVFRIVKTVLGRKRVLIEFKVQFEVRITYNAANCARFMLQAWEQSDDRLANAFYVFTAS